MLSRHTNETVTCWSEQEISRRIGVSRPTLQRWRRGGIGPTWYRLGPRRIVYPDSGLLEWLAAQERAPQAA